MNKVKFISGIIVAILAVSGAIGVINKILNYNGSAFSSGGIGGSIAITFLAAAGSVMLFKSAKKKEKSSEKDMSESNNERVILSFACKGKKLVFYNSPKEVCHSESTGRCLLGRTNPEYIGMCIDSSVKLVLADFAKGSA